MSRLSVPCSETCWAFAEDFAALRLLDDLSVLSDLADLPDEDAFSDLSEVSDFFDFSDLPERDSDFCDFFEAAEADTPEEVLSEGELAEAASAFMGAVNSIHVTATASMEGQREYFMIIPWLHSSRLSGECRADHARGPDPGDSPMTVEAPCAPDRSVSLGDAFS